MPVRPPLQPMLARLARELPADGYLYEPKWDGFRCLAFRDGDAVDLRSRNDRPFARYFPEVVAALLTLPNRGFVLDGEIVVTSPRGFDFEALMLRLHPAASRVERLRRETPASYIAFDVLSLDAEDLRARPFEERRRSLEQLLVGVPPPIFLTPATDDVATARAWLGPKPLEGIDGVVAKPRSLRYEAGKRAMTKVKTEHSVDCVVGGMRMFEDLRVASLLLGVYDHGGALLHVGVASSFTDAQRRRLFEELAPLRTTLQGHAWEKGYGLESSPVGRLSGSAGRWTPDLDHDWLPLRAERVCEVAYTQLDGMRFRFPARFLRWRPDRDPRSCTIEQLEQLVREQQQVLPVREGADGDRRA